MSQASHFLSNLRAKAPDGRAPYALLWAFIVAFGTYKVLSIGFDRPAELWLACAFDASFWALCWLLSELSVEARGCAREQNNERRIFGRERAASVFFYFVLYASGALVFAHTWFYDDASERRLTLLDVSARGVADFFHMLPVKGYLAFAGLFVGLHALALVLLHFLQRPRLSRAWTMVLGLGLVSALSALAVPRTPPSALFDSAYGAWQFVRLPHVRATAVASDVQRRNLLDKSTSASLPAPRFNKVIVLVMETMTSERLGRELRDVPQGSFLRTSQHVHTYSRYFANNQDSRTGMLAMLTSRVIPYEAYNLSDLAAYNDISRTQTLVDRMRRLGYQSAFALSQVVPEEVVVDLKWDQILHLQEPEIPGFKQRHLCLVPDPWETSCEDVVLIPRIVDFLAKSERAFVYQEFIWGHAIEYNQLSGKSNARFYSEYVDALIAALAQRGMLDDTLIAITSDHGYRAQVVQNQAHMYELPLRFYATRFAQRSDARLLSHVDFKDLLFDELSDSSTFATPNQHVFIQGPTGSGMSAAISQRGVLTLIKERAGSHMLLAQKPAGQNGELSPGQILYLFERHRERFDQALRMTR